MRAGRARHRCHEHLGCCTEPPINAAAAHVRPANRGHATVVYSCTVQLYMQTCSLNSEHSSESAVHPQGPQPSHLEGTSLAQAGPWHVRVLAVLRI